MIRLLVLALFLMPPASLPAIAGPTNDVVACGSPAFSISDETSTAPEAPEDSETEATFTPMQEEIIADHDSTLSPFLAAIWEKHESLPTSPLFPVSLVDLFRPPKHA